MHTLRFIRDVKLGIKNLMLHSLRSLLTMLGVVFGVGSVVAMLSVGEGASAEAMKQIQKLGSTNIIITSVKPQEDDNASGNSSRGFMSIYGLFYDDDPRVRESFPAVVRTVPAKIVPKEARVGQQAMDLRVVGTTPDWFSLVDRPIVAGRALSWRDIEESAGVCVLAETAARRLLAGNSIVGQAVRIGGDYFTVVGIVHSEEGGSGGNHTPDEPNDAYIPINVVRQHFGDMTVKRSTGSRSMERVELHQLIVEVDSVDNVESTATAVRSMLARFHKKVDYDVSVPLALLRQARATHRIFSIVLASIAGISLLVGGIGIMNIMLANVSERTREIGIRRAIGARRRQIIAQFLIETVVLSGVGGVIGVAVGLLIPFLITYFAQMPTVVTTWSVVLSLGISGLVGVLFGLYPAYRAATVDPIIALRHE
jgi:putative ABC transport system permease protein